MSGSGSPSWDAMGDEEQNPRLFIPNFLTPHQCKELEFIHKSNCAVGYRPHVFSTTLAHLVATNSAHLIMPLVPIRASLMEKVESFFQCEFELCIEFTGLISWSKGASIGWHSDDNRSYLRQRDFTDGDPGTVAPSAGDVLIYTADSRNVHSVDEITMGERLTLTLWFSRDGSHDEDVKLISQLSQIFPRQMNDVPITSIVPFPASDTMYWFSAHHSSSDLVINICCGRLHALGFSIYYSEDPTNDLLLSKPLKVTRKDEYYNFEFSNLLHALQVLQYCFWKSSELRNAEVRTLPNKEVVALSPSQKQRVRHHESMFLKDSGLLEVSFGRTGGSAMDEFSWDWLATGLDDWSSYSKHLHLELLRYVKNDVVREARKVFDVMPDRNVVPWTAMVRGRIDDARRIYDMIPEKDVVARTNMLGGYCQVGRLVEAREIFDEMPKRNVFAWTAMITGYAQNQRVDIARKLFEVIPEKNEVSWMTILMGYTQSGRMKEASELFDAMLVKSVVCCNAMILGYGQTGEVDNARKVASVLITMYIKCGSLVLAKMIFERFDPNVLSACSYTGKLEKGLEIFYLMKSKYSVEPQPERYVCMVDILGHAGKLNEAMNLIAEMPMQADAIIWSSLLLACRVHLNLDLAEIAAEKLSELEPDNAGP
ncbi:hypothetical protein MLD38_005406 [Melastoma candidum]|uniref:Uncharacterized protein n=1 Tax=Melastoma candidum TaxID=119954 RepID=A0ACB9RJ96_9MYRT|nr:hypothetical protein MLD38_005406 [Melastoma candidum]